MAADIGRLVDSKLTRVLDLLLSRDSDGVVAALSRPPDQYVGGSGGRGKLSLLWVPYTPSVVQDHSFEGSG
jgi:hypothetical protein